MPTSDRCVIYNPAAARGRAGRIWKRLQDAWRGRAEFWPTSQPRHAEELAQSAVGLGFQTIVAAGGDGTVHEVANGLLKGVIDGGAVNVALGIFPIGSANDYAYALGLRFADCLDAERTPRRRRVDVGRVRLSDGRERFFINSMGLGFSGGVCLESRSLKRFRGLALYGFGLARTLWKHFDKPNMTIRLDEQELRGPTLSATVAIGSREGNFLVAPQARIDDGLFDYFIVGDINRWQALCHVPRLALGRPPGKNLPVYTGQCRQADIESENALIIHLDGELFCLPEERVCKVEAALLPGRLLVEW